MIREEIHFTDLNGNPNSTVAYFNLSVSEVLDLEVNYPGGWVNAVQGAMERQDGSTVYKMFVDLIERSYGRKSEDGTRFAKNPEWLKAFKESPAWDEFFMNLLSDSNAAGKFFKGVLPDDFEAKAKRFREANKEAAVSEEAKILGLTEV